MCVCLRVAVVLFGRETGTTDLEACNVDGTTFGDAEGLVVVVVAVFAATAAAAAAA
jgi:hypothetical protein